MIYVVLFVVVPVSVYGIGYWLGGVAGRRKKRRER